MTAKEESEAVLVTTPYRNFADSKCDFKTVFPESNPVLMLFLFLFVSLVISTTGSGKLWQAIYLLTEGSKCFFFELRRLICDERGYYFERLHFTQMSCFFVLLTEGLDRIMIRFVKVYRHRLKHLCVKEGNMKAPELTNACN